MNPAILWPVRPLFEEKDGIDESVITAASALIAASRAPQTKAQLRRIAIEGKWPFGPVLFGSTHKSRLANTGCA
ncbi:MAG: hypothetical protein WB755_23770 [Terriglobales bacterium]